MKLGSVLPKDLKKQLAERWAWFAGVQYRADAVSADGSEVYRKKARVVRQYLAYLTSILYWLDKGTIDEIVPSGLKELVMDEAMRHASHYRKMLKDSELLVKILTDHSEYWELMFPTLEYEIQQVELRRKGVRLQAVK